MIKIAINELSDYKVDENFGVAPSTNKYKQACVQ
jgi:PHP family Zn ribbon phosphoesterase